VRHPPTTTVNRRFLLCLGLVTAAVSVVFGLLVFLNARSKTSELHAAVSWLLITTTCGSLYMLWLKVARYRLEHYNNADEDLADPQGQTRAINALVYRAPDPEFVKFVTMIFYVLIFLDLLIPFVIWLILMKGEPLRHRAIFIGITSFFIFTAHLKFMFKMITASLDADLVLRAADPAAAADPTTIPEDDEENT
jgi:hypothetical protein